MGKVDANKEMKRIALYNTAFELFTTQGTAKTTISDIVNKAGVAKGTFYLYFKDKYDIRSRLVEHKTQEILRDAHQAIHEKNVTGFVSQIHFLVDFIVDRLEGDPQLMSFIHKNLSMGIFREMLEDSGADKDGYNFREAYYEFLSQDGSVSYTDPELLIFTIIELVSGVSYSCIVQKQPVSMEIYRPYLHSAIDGILDSFSGRK
ncbi:MAG: TetR/AcrR family transcriptional regulator [Lachnospiraceae bacterium]|nr:TetR/AcrR family transcriptional regulator [Lachnospiraceae bacterium]